MFVARRVCVVILHPMVKEGQQPGAAYINAICVRYVRFSFFFQGGGLLAVEGSYLGTFYFSLLCRLQLLFGKYVESNSWGNASRTRIIRKVQRKLQV